MEVVLPGTEMLIVFISLFVIVGASCPDGQIWHEERSTCCTPTFDCGIDSEVRICSQNGGSDECVSCGDGRTNGYVTSSLNYFEHRCFNKSQQHIDCPRGDTVPIPKFADEKCSQPCRCRYEDCFFGDSCACSMAEKCKQDEELDPDTGKCRPCPEGKHKPTEGCQPCVWKEGSTVWMHQVKQMNATVVATDSVDKDPKETKGETDPPSSDPGYTLKTDGKPEPEPEGSSNDDSGGMSMAPVIIVIVILVAIGLLIAIVLVVLRRQIKSGDNTSRLVVCYYKLTGSQPPPQTPQDPEAGNSHVDEVPEERTKPVQEVTPTIQSSAASASPGGVEGEPMLDTLHPLETETETNADANTTTTPLIGGTEREDDETEQKTKELGQSS